MRRCPTHTPNATNEGNYLSPLALISQTGTSYGCVSAIPMATTEKTHKTGIARTKCQAFQKTTCEVFGSTSSSAGRNLLCSGASELLHPASKAATALAWK